MESSIKEGKLSVIASHIRDIKKDKYNAELAILTHEGQGAKHAEYLERLEQNVHFFSKQIEDLETQYKAVESE